MKYSLRYKLSILAVALGLYSLNAMAQCQFENGKVVVVSHRGDWCFAAENSIEGFNSSVGLGVNMIELDLQKTKDGQLILLHDKTLDRTTTGKGYPSDYTLSEIKQLVLKNGCGVPTSQKVPTLEEAMLVVKGKIWVNVDKGYEYFDDVLKVLERTGTTKQVIIKASVPYEQIIKEHPDVLNKLIFMPIINCDDPKALDIIDKYIKKVHPVAFEITFKTLTPNVLEIVKRIKEGGSKVWINSLWPSLCAGMNDDKAIFEHQVENTWAKIVDLGASFIQTDRPQQLISYLKFKGLYVSNQTSENIRQKLISRDQSYGFVASHRGDWLRYPENSIEAINSAICHGADIVEIDIQKTKDGVLVLSHDETIDRCTTGHGRIEDLTLSELKNLHLKDRDGRETSYVMPTLSEAMLACKGKALVNIDKGERFVEETMQVLHQTETADIAILKSYANLSEVKSRYGKYLKEIIYMPIINMDLPNAEDMIREFDRELKPVAYELNYKKNEALAIKAQSILKDTSLLWFNSLNGRNLGHDDRMSLSCPENGFGYLVDNYKANIIQTDIPRFLVEFYKSKGLR